MQIEASGSTDTGKRQRNEDALAVDPSLGLYLVSDGMGGYAGGAIASKLVVDTIAEFLARSDADPDITWPSVPAGHLSEEESRVLVALRLAHRAVVQRRRGVLANMGATAAMLAVRGDRAVLAHVGDSRVYRLRAGELVQLTRDHSFVEEMLARGALSADERARVEAQFGHVITRAMGNDREIEPDLRTLLVLPGDVFVLCTDGVHGVLSPDEMGEIVAMHAPSIAADLLVARALDAGSNDNVTAIVVRAR